MLRSLFATAAVFAAALACAPGAAQPLETAVKAAFLPKFAPYVVWPTAAAPAEPIVLCVVGTDPFGGLIDEAAAGLKVEQHPIVVRRMASADGARECQIAFLGGAAAQRTGLRAFRDTPVLTVTDARDGADRGVVHFVVQGGRVRFVIDDALAARGNLAISAKLLSLAVKVTPRGRP